MSEDELVRNRVRSITSGTPGRSVTHVGRHELLIDEPTHLGGPGEEITPADAFLSGVSSCGVLLVQGRAREAKIPLQRVEVSLEARRHRRDTSIFLGIDMTFRLAGPSQAQAVELVEHYKAH